MSNHARGLWGYTGAASGTELTIQSTGMGGPSAAIVLGDLAELGVRRVVRVGSCVAFDGGRRPGDLLLVAGAVAAGGSAASFGVAPGETIGPDAELSDALAAELGEAAHATTVASLDALPGRGGGLSVTIPASSAADMQTAALLARAGALGIAAAATLIVAEAGGGAQASDEDLERAAKRAGTAAKAVLSG